MTIETDRPSRREFLGRTLALGAAGLVVPGVALADEPGLIVRSRRPLDAETPVEVFEAWRTPNRLFFVRSHWESICRYVLGQHQLPKMQNKYGICHFSGKQ